MRLYEIDATLRSVVATRRFKREFSEVVRTDAGLRDILNDFIDFRRTARPDMPFNAKDSAMSNRLKGWRHCHLRHGRIILIYSIDDRTLFLVSITNHAGYDKSNYGAMLPYLSKLTPSDFTTVDLSEPDKQTADLSKLRDELSDLAYSLAADPESRVVLQKLASGSADEFLEYAQMIPAEGRDILRAYGSKQAMMDTARKILRDTDG